MTSSGAEHRHGRPTFAPPAAPALSFFARVTVDVATPIDIGMTHEGERRVVPITGGTVDGEGWSGRVLAVGADVQRYPSPEVAELQARYVIEADDGSHVLVENSAVRIGTTEDLRAVMAGEPVDPSRIYFRCVPRLAAPLSSVHAWVNGRVFIGTGRRLPDAVVIDIFAVD